MPFSIDLSPPDDVSPPRTAATCLRIHMHAKEQKQGVEGTGSGVLLTTEISVLVELTRGPSENCAELQTSMDNLICLERNVYHGNCSNSLFA